MPLMPKRVKYRKMQRGRMKGKATRGSTLFYGDYGLQILQPAWLSNIQIEAARVAISHYLKTRGRLWVRVFPDKPITKKAAESRLGKGKGEVTHWVAVILPGRIIFEIGGVDAPTAKEALRLASYKMPFRSRTIMREMQ